MTGKRVHLYLKPRAKFIYVSDAPIRAHSEVHIYIILMLSAALLLLLSSHKIDHRGRVFVVNQRKQPTSYLSTSPALYVVVLKSTSPLTFQLCLFLFVLVLRWPWYPMVFKWRGRKDGEHMRNRDAMALAKKLLYPSADDLKGGGLHVLVKWVIWRW